MRRTRTLVPGTGLAWRALLLSGCCALACVPDGTLAQEAGRDADGGARWYTAGPGVDWSLGARGAYTVTGDINRDLEPDNQDRLLTNALEAGLVLDAETRRSLLSAELGVRASYFLGDDPDIDGDTRLDPRAALRGTYRGRTYTVDGTLNFDAEQASLAQAGDTGIVAGETTQFTVTYSARLAQQLDELNTLSLGSTGTMLDFSEDSPDLIPSRTVGISAAWEHRLTETSTPTFETGVRPFDADDAVNTQSHTLDLLFSLTHRRTPRHTFGGSIGVTAVRTEADGTGTDEDLGLTGGGSLEYLFRNGTAGVDFSQSVEPSAEGALQSFSRLGTTLTYEVNAHERFSLLGALSRRTPLGGSGDTFDFYSLGASYAFDVTETAALTLGYTFLGNNDSAAGAATGHQVLLSLGRSFDLTR